LHAGSGVTGGTVESLSQPNKRLVMSKENSKVLKEFFILLTILLCKLDGFLRLTDYENVNSGIVKPGSVDEPF